MTIYRVMTENQRHLFSAPIVVLKVLFSLSPEAVKRIEFETENDPGVCNISFNNRPPRAYPTLRNIIVQKEPGT